MFLELLANLDDNVNKQRRLSKVIRGTSRQFAKYRAHSLSGDSTTDGWSKPDFGQTNEQQPHE
jgi:hypothetical protein